MKIKRFFLLLFFVVSTLFVNDDKVTISASNQNEISNNSFELSSSRNASLLLLNNNVVYGWGLWGEHNNISFSKKLLSPTDISKNIILKENEEFIDVFSGEQHSFVLTSLGRVFAMGSGQQGQLGYNDYLFKSNLFDITSMFSLGADEKIIHIACGSDFNIALTNKNKVLSFGDRKNGKLGVKENELIEVVYDISDNFNLQEDDYIVDVVCGASFSLALSKNGYLYGWGDNSFSQLSLPESIVYTPTLIDIYNSTISKIACGRYTSYVLTNQSQLYGFGSDSYGQLATHNPPLFNSKKEKPYLMNSSFSLESGEFIKDIVSGYNYAIVKTNLKNFYSFGDNSSGQLANCSTITTSVPQKIEYETLLEIGDEIISVSCGENHCIALTKNNHVLSWGSNLYGQLALDENINVFNNKITDITHNFPPIITISTNASSIEFIKYDLDVDVYYLDNKKIDSIYYFISENQELINPTWIQYKDGLTIETYEGNIYVHLKIDSNNKTYYHVSKAYFLDHVAPSISLYNKNNEGVLEINYVSVKS